MKNVFIMDHPLIKHKIGLIRRKEIGTKEFRETIGEIAMLECYESSKTLRSRRPSARQPFRRSRARSSRSFRS